MRANWGKRLIGAVGLVVLSLAYVFGAPNHAKAQTAHTFQAAPWQVAAEIELRERLSLSDPRMQQNFPRLGNNYVVRGPSTRDYNCIGWTVGITNLWLWPGDRLTDFDRFYAAWGYVRQQGLNLAVENGKEKIVLMAILNKDATINKVTHGVVQHKDGTWSSKLGGMALIQHSNLEVLRGRAYGTPVAVYTRPAN
jgi:hypothetical protein